jgi:predicted HicB family RNase H-like nuclease
LRECLASAKRSGVKKLNATIAARVSQETRDKLTKKAAKRKIRLTDIAREALEKAAQ